MPLGSFMDKAAGAAHAGEEWPCPGLLPVILRSCPSDVPVMSLFAIPGHDDVTSR